ncbi:XRE family transcriptional regulator [Pedobacter frigidisoli]|uniref:XRE family transcriptional regulator n=1 Tax=Pedobacter frigidisoli TaxID=2530455 RepID=A0A4R0NYX3_9SPHI|nr:helix-turn-helix transcriptional regulator [Pedobacter frigidisoli]TCD07670.1 XRE family transcriptional regulator [Pedobacter frigidisoli]
MPSLKVIISEIDYNVILNVKKLREERGISQRELSELMTLSQSFVGKAEALGQPEKYSLRHLRLIAKALSLDSIKEIMPPSVPENDMIEITYEKVSRINERGVVGKKVEDKVISIKATERSK